MSTQLDYDTPRTRKLDNLITNLLNEVAKMVGGILNPPSGKRRSVSGAGVLDAIVDIQVFAKQKERV